MCEFSFRSSVHACLRPDASAQTNRFPFPGGSGKRFHACLALLGILSVKALAAFTPSVFEGDVVITEFAAATSDRLVYWPDEGLPTIGAGIPWTDLAYNDTGWREGPGGFGSGANGESTVVNIRGTAFSCYIRQVFQVDADLAAMQDPLELVIDYEEGFIAYLNGVEVARRGLGSPGGFSYYDQVANNDLRTPGVPEVYQLGQARDLLRVGSNVIAVKVAKYRIFDTRWTVSAGLRVASNPVRPVVAPNSVWRYWPGLSEPLGGLRAPVNPDPQFPDPALVYHGDIWRYFIGTSEPSGGLNLDWTRVGFDDYSWGQGPGGFGYGDGDDATILPMQGVAMSVYIRREFTPTEEQMAFSDKLELSVDFDDAFVAYINGVEVARGNIGTPGIPVPFNAAANSDREAGVAINYVIEGAWDLLNPGVNVLAIQAHNRSINSSDLSIIPNLRFFYNDLDVESTADLSDEEDWIELHNRGSSLVSLSGWSLTDSASNPAKWVFPNVSMPPGSYLVVRASGLDRRPTDGSPLHTNFRLSGSGEYLALFDNASPRNPRTVFSPAYPRQSHFHSFGLVGADGRFAYQRPASPGQPNNPSEIGDWIIEIPEADVPAGFYDSAVTVSIFTSEPGASIRYTLDGSVPTLVNGMDYTGPVAVAQSISLRARAFRAGLLPSPPLTRVYLINEPAALKTLPALVLSGDETRDLFEPHGLMAISGGYANLWPPTEIDHYNNGIPAGRAYERPVAAGVIFPHDNSGFQVDAGYRTAGRAGRTTRRRSPVWNNQTHRYSLRLYFRNAYGHERIEYPLFPDARINSYKQLSINSGFWDDNTNPALKDELMRRLIIDCGQPASAGTHVNLFINGVFKSYLNMVERPVESFFQDYFNSSNNWEIFKLSNDFGNKATYNWLYAYAVNPARNAANYADYLEMAERLDMVNFADYLIVNVYGGNCDWPGNNWIMARESIPGAKFRFLPWDSGCAFGFSGTTAINTFDKLDLPNQSGPAARFYYFLKNSPEFRLIFADRIQKHFFHGGAMTDANILRRYLELKEVMRPPVMYMQGSFNNNVEADWVPKRRPIVMAQFAQQGLWPTLAAPDLEPRGGVLVSGQRVDLGTPPQGGAIYFTLDGTDPREAGSGIPRGTLYQNPISLSQSTWVKARAYSGGQWSPLSEALFTPERRARVVVTEVMYNPPDWQGWAHTALEFIELSNLGNEEILLNGYSFCEGISFIFPSGAVLQPGEYLVLASNPAAFGQRYPGVAVYGQYGGQLSNSGERVRLCDPSGETVFLLDYTDLPPWPVSADGWGFSFVPRDPQAINPLANTGWDWRASANPGGSPGEQDPPSAVPPVVVNEVLTRSDLPLRDTVELYNPTSAPADISGWYLSDNPSIPRKYQFPSGSVIGPGQFLVVDEADFNPNPGVAPSFAFSATGESVLLSSSTPAGVFTGYSHGFAFGPSAKGVSFGRHLTSTGEEHFPAQRSLTLGGANSGPLVGPVVISEIHYKPAPSGLQFIELVNLSAEAVALHHPTDLDLTWRVAGVDFNFPQGVTLAAGEVVLISRVSPQELRQYYGIPDSVRIFGPWPGNLSEEGEAITVRYPDSATINDQGQVVVSYIDVDRVVYSNRQPWPEPPAGQGPSLQRINLFAYGNDPANWAPSGAVGGSPGQKPGPGFASWVWSSFREEDQHDPAIVGPLADPDGDGLSNLVEYALGLDPMIPEQTADEHFPVEPVWVDDEPFLTATFRLRRGTDLTVRVEVSGDAAEWHWGPSSVSVVTQPLDGDFDLVIARDRTPFGGDAAPRFMRLRVALGGDPQ